MAKIYKEGQFVVLEGTNMEGDSWQKGSSTYLDDAQMLIDNYDKEHPNYKKRGKEIRTTEELKKFADTAGVNSQAKIRVKLLVDKEGTLDEKIELDIKEFDDNEKLEDDAMSESTHFFLISKNLLTETNSKDLPGGILTASASTFTFHIGQKVNQYFLFVFNNKNRLGGAGPPAGSGLGVPPSP